MKGPTQPRPCISSQEFLWSFEHHGLMIMIDWNIVCQRMKPIDYIIFFLGKKPSLESLVMLFLVTQGILIGRMWQIDDFLIIVVVVLLVVATKRQGNVLMTLVIKGQVSHISLSPIL